MTGVGSTEITHIYKHLQMTSQPVSQSVSPPSRSVSISALFKLQSKLNNSRIVTRTVRRTITIFLFCLSPVLNSRFRTKTITSIESKVKSRRIFLQKIPFTFCERKIPFYKWEARGEVNIAEVTVRGHQLHQRHQNISWAEQERLEAP